MTIWTGYPSPLSGTHLPRLWAETPCFLQDGAEVRAKVSRICRLVPRVAWGKELEADLSCQPSALSFQTAFSVRRNGEMICKDGEFFLSGCRVRAVARMGGMEEFPQFMKNRNNRSARSNQATAGVEGYVFDGVDGSQMAFWRCAEDAPSAQHVHDFDEYMVVVQGCYDSYACG